MSSLVTITLVCLVVVNESQECFQVNAISMMGLLSSWILELHYLFISGIMAFFYQSHHFREVAAILKLFEFVLIPLLQILTSAPIRGFIRLGSRQS